MTLKACILYFNKPSLTSRCLKSTEAALSNAGLTAQSIFFVNNGSIAEVPAPVSQTITLAPNQGFARGMNTGLRAAFADQATRWVLLLSNDVELESDFFRNAQIRMASFESSATILCPHVYYLSDKTKSSYTHGILDLATNELTHHFDQTLGSIEFPRYYPAAATLWNRAAFERLGGFNDAYFCYWEDVELAYRCKKNEVKLISAPFLKIHHLGRGTTGSKSGYSEHFKRGKELTLAILRKRD